MVEINYLLHPETLSRGFHVAVGRSHTLDLKGRTVYFSSPVIIFETGLGSMAQESYR